MAQRSRMGPHLRRPGREEDEPRTPRKGRHRGSVPGDPGCRRRELPALLAVRERTHFRRTEKLYGPAPAMGPPRGASGHTLLVRTQPGPLPRASKGAP
jgi:hypothetical protein